jgi:hypothetical protein
MAVKQGYGQAALCITPALELDLSNLRWIGAIASYDLF